MGKKKKDKDFQKVRIKVGRKLKRQNETVVDLTTKKIKLPKERAVETESSGKNPAAIFDEAVSSLDLEKNSAQLQAIQLINRILDPFVRQMLSLTTSESACLIMNAKQLQQSVAIFRAIFHSQLPTELGVQLGTLLSALHRLCRGVQDPRLGPSLVRLSSSLIKLISFHPKFVDLLNALDGCAIALLQRPESTWLWVGCQLSSLVLQAHSQLVSAATLRSDRGSISDVAEQLVRSNIYSRALMRLYTDLREKQSIVNVTTHRTYLLQATLAFLKDHQYTMRSSLPATARHPFLLPRPTILPSSQFTIDGPPSLHFPIDGYSMHSVLRAARNHVGSSIDVSLIEMESPALLHNPRGIESKHNAAGGNASSKKSRNRSAMWSEPPLWLDQAMQDQMMLINLLEQGIDLLGESALGFNEAVLEDLYCVIRGFRVFLESKPVNNLKYGNVNKTINVYGTVSRFCHKLYSQFPFRQPSEINQGLSRSHASMDDQSTTPSQSLLLPPPPPPGSTKQDIRRWQKRLVKLQNRQKRSGGDDNLGKTDSQSSTAVPHDLPQPSTAGGNWTHRHCPQSVHRVNQSVIELLALLETCDFPATTNNASCWPPPTDMLQRVVHYLLHDLFPVDSRPVTSRWPLPVALGWLRTFDLYLLAPVRFPNRFLKTIDHSRRLLSAPILAVLGRFLNDLPKDHPESDSTPLKRGQHRLFGRTAGLLTAYLSMEMRRLRLARSETAEVENESSDSWDYQLDYDESWIGRTLSDYGLSTTLAEPVFVPLIETLRHMIKNEPPRILYAPPVSEELRRVLNDQVQQCYARSQFASIPVHIVDDTWAQCLLRLIHCRYAPAFHVRNADPSLQEKLNQAEKRANRINQLRDLRDLCGFVIPDGAEEHFGWLVDGYLPSLDGRYACPYFWRAVKDSV